MAAAWLGEALRSIVGDAPEAAKDLPLNSFSTRRAAMLTEELLLATPRTLPDDFVNGFSMDEHLEDAKQLLEHEHIATIRYTLVPAMMNEAEFWRRAFYVLERLPTRQAPDRLQDGAQ